MENNDLERGLVLGNIRYLCRGKRIYIKNNIALYITYVAITVPIALFYYLGFEIYEVKSIIIIFSTVTLILLLDIYTLFDVSTTSPGYLVQNIRRDSTQSVSKEIKVLSIIDVEIELKFCETCSIIREPRSFHCRVCDTCILRQDHHCPWVGNCVGKNNYFKFLFFIFVTFSLSMVIFISTIISYFDDNIRNGLKTINLFLVIYSGSIAVTLIGLLGYNAYLITINKTTNEHMRRKFMEKNPFDKGCLGNWSEFFNLNT